ncbi:MAG: formylglycine-generating enzyme family protein, partial [Methylococcaceae bacterium]|nr:formylglycine-generating enzyme family protein [Methylococcaceae bacterium]
IGKYPVTWVQYRSFIASEQGYRNKKWWQGLLREKLPGKQFRKVLNHPVEMVSWYDAVAFCRWLSACLGYEVRLPTEWEWQMAATLGDTKRVFPWGRSFHTDFSNTFESGLSRTTAVGMYPQGAALSGALDMSGNVWEWCLNEFDHPERTESEGNAFRVVRGGSWRDVQRNAGSSYRGGDAPDDRVSHLGFRLCSSAPIIHK